EFGDDANAAFDEPVLAAGRQQGQAPHWAVVLGARFDRPVTDTLDVYATANYTWYSEMFLADEAEEPLFSETQDAYDIVTATLGVRAFEDTVDLSAFCRNCFDTEYVTNAFNQTFQSGGAPMVRLGAPATYGVRARYNF
ncbi:MAG: hypothetical protein MI723_02540, partial [Caulobacterales bacterium]|nr:hypothetical protein [Caulobacterales bacterium]